MQDVAFRRETIISPKALDMDQSSLSQTLDGVLERGQRNGRGRPGLARHDGIRSPLNCLIIHGYSFSIISTPAGRFS